MSPLSTTPSVGVMASLSHYPVVHVVPSAVSSAWVSPEPVRELYSSGTLDVLPVYEPSPNLLLYVPATSPVTTALPEGPLQLLGTESLSPGGPASMDSLLAYDITLLDRDQDLSLLPVLLLPLPDDFRLLPDTALGPHPVSAGPSQPEPWSPVVSPP